MADGETRTQRRRQRTNVAIIDAAEAAFAGGGYETASIEQIAEAADVAVGSVYNHFGSKEGLLWAVAERALATDEAYMDAAYLPDRAPLERVLAAGEWYARFAVEHPEPFRLLAFPHRPQSGPAAEAAQRVADRVEATNRRLVAAIQDGIDAGVLRPVDAEAAATFLWAAWNGVLALSWRPDHLRRDPTELLQVGVDLLLHGIVSPSDSGHEPASSSMTVQRARAAKTAAPR